MNKFLLASLFLIISVLLVSAVSASLTGTDITLGDDDTEAANPNWDDGDGKDSHESGTFTLTSSGDGDITDLVCTISPVSDYKNIHSSDEDDFVDDLDMNLTYATTITSGISINVTVNARIPAQLDAVDGDGDEKAFQTATIACTGTEAGSPVTKSIKVYMQRESMLEIDEIYVTVDGFSDSDSSDPAKFDVERTDSVEIEVIVENKYTNNDDVEIEDITVYAKSFDENIAEDEDDVENTDEDAADLDPKEDDSVELMTFEVHEEAKGTYDGIIYVVGEDEFGARHGEKWDIEFDVEVEKNDLRITKATFSQNNLSCDRTTTLYVEGINIGKVDEDDVVLTVINSDLDISEYKEYDEIEKPGDDNDFSASFTFTIADSVKAQTYPISIKLYRDVDNIKYIESGKLEYVIKANLIVKDCTPSTTTNTTSTTVVTTLTTTANETEAEVGTSTEKSFFESPTYFNILIGINAIAILAVIALGILFLKPKP